MSRDASATFLEVDALGAQPTCLLAHPGKHTVVDEAIVDLLVLEIGKKVQVLEYHKEFDETLEV